MEKGNIFPRRRKKTEKEKEDNIWSREEREKKNGAGERGKYHPRSPPILPVKRPEPHTIRIQ